jgi:hypothetical protein
MFSFINLHRWSSVPSDSKECIETITFSSSNLHTYKLLVSTPYPVRAASPPGRHLPRTAGAGDGLRTVQVYTPRSTGVLDQRN